ncbi:furin-1-like [Anneissia japonica]|uniref:furin-1-like n=1 Tax=Anneissia japonica TaxID=1529436 RepID=UPI001425B2A0|nr:furin-1-like [Anneissia japonica]
MTVALRIISFVLNCIILCQCSNGLHYSSFYAAHVVGSSVEAAELATKYGYTYHGQIGSLTDYYLFSHGDIKRRSILPSSGEHINIKSEPMVKWFEQQIHMSVSVSYTHLDVYKRQTLLRSNREAQLIGDPDYDTLHILLRKVYVYPHRYIKHCGLCISLNSSSGSDHRVVEAWQQGYTGKGIVVTVIDDGIERNHPDLIANFEPLASYDFIDWDNDPLPKYTTRNSNK